MESAQNIEVEFESTEKDFQRVLFWYHRTRMLLEYILMVVLGILFCYFLGFDLLDIKNNGLVILVFVATLSVLLVLDVYRKCFFQAKKLKAVAHPAKTIFSEKGVESITPIASTNRDWENYSKIYETKKDFIFFSQENFFATIPKRFFKNQSDIISLRKLIEDKVGDRAKLLT